MRAGKRCGAAPRTPCREERVISLDDRHTHKPMHTRNDEAECAKWHGITVPCAAGWSKLTVKRPSGRHCHAPCRSCKPTHFPEANSRASHFVPTFVALAMAMGADRIKDLFRRYGKIALGVHLTVYASFFTGEAKTWTCSRLFMLIRPAKSGAPSPRAASHTLPVVVPPLPPADQAWCLVAGCYLAIENRVDVRGPLEKIGLLSSECAIWLILCHATDLDPASRMPSAAGTACSIVHLLCCRQSKQGV
jgi:hypothetical protein